MARGDASSASRCRRGPSECVVRGRLLAAWSRADRSVSTGVSPTRWQDLSVVSLGPSRRGRCRRRLGPFIDCCWPLGIDPKEGSPRTAWGSELRILTPSDAEQDRLLEMHSIGSVFLLLVPKIRKAELRGAWGFHWLHQDRPLAPPWGFSSFSPHAPAPRGFPLPRPAWLSSCRLHASCLPRSRRCPRSARLL